MLLTIFINLFLSNCSLFLYISVSLIHQHVSDICTTYGVFGSVCLNNLYCQVTAAKRPKNSALEVDLDFEHNVRPAPVITEEVTATLEEIIQKRIIEVNILFLLLTYLML